jgi:FecR protein
MNRSHLKIAIVLAAGVLLLLAATFLISQQRRTLSGPDLGKFSVIDGRVEFRKLGSRDWHSPIEGDDAESGIQIRVGTNGSATIRDEHHQIILGPDTDISSAWKKNQISIQLQSGEVAFTKIAGDYNYVISTEFGQVQASEPASFLVTRSAGSYFASVVHENGLAVVEQNGTSRELNEKSEPLMLSSKNVQGLWLLTPHPEEALPSREGHAAVVFTWGETNYPTSSEETDDSSNILIRNLNTGEMITRDEVRSGSQMTLPAGSYSWTVNSRQLITSTRRFHITGMSSEDVRSLPAVGTEVEKAENADNIEEAEVNAPSEPVEAAPGAAPEATPSAAPETAPEASAEMPALKIVEPHKSAQIPISAVAEQRVRWQSSGQAESLELQIVGSSGNPSLQFAPAGSRTRQKLSLLPPGRYTVKLRAILGSGTAKRYGDWYESFFDVIQTEVGQLAPTDVSAKFAKPNNHSEIVIQWKKSAAPLYRVKVTGMNEASMVQVVNKSKITLAAPKSGSATISICALDANRQIRGCAPDIKWP